MDTILSLLLNPDFQFGVLAGAGLASAGFVAFLALLGACDEREDRRSGGALARVEHLQHTGDAIFYGDRPAPQRTPAAANDDATLDLRDAYRRPRGRRADMRSGPR